MTRKPPTPSETEALQFLWDMKSATVPELHTQISGTKPVGYTTVQKRLQRMEEKGLVKRVPGAGRAIRYEAVSQPQTTRKSLVKRLLKTAFDDSPNALIQHAIGEHKLSAEDIDDIRRLLDAVEKSKSRGEKDG